jgi:hypothetical protein
MMGYYTKFTLMVHKGNADIKQVIIGGAGMDAYFDRAFDDEGDGEDPCTWDNHEETIKKVSKLFPETVLALYGEGEENGDIWYKYFLNGKMQYCPATISFEDFDETKLK